MTADPFDTVSYDDCGFDISDNNGSLDFQQLGGAGGRKFCILKLTEGLTYVDQAFAPYMTALMQQSSITRFGVYHFAHHESPIDQMEYFLNAFTAWKRNLSGGSVTQYAAPAPEFLFMLDLERGANPPVESDGLAMVQYLKNLGIQPMIYCGYDFWSQNWPALDSCSCFLAAYDSTPTSPIPWRIPSASVYGWDLWQYTGDSLGPWAKNLPGGSSGMDLSCFNLLKHPTGVEAWWDAQLAATTQPA